MIDRLFGNTKFWRRLWLALTVIVLTFEGIAIADDTPGNTISENVWDLLEVAPVVWFVFAGILTWLYVHLLGPRVSNWFKKWRKKTSV